MARKLPWLANDSKKSRAAGDNKGTVSVKRQRLTPAAKGNETGNGEHRDDGEPAQKHRARRNASSSPPPAPPDEVFMIDGFDADDGWRLVEDEFETTARLFTRHLHQAEYQRQKDLARTRNQSTVDAIAGLAHDDDNANITRAVTYENTKVNGQRAHATHGRNDDPLLSDPRLAGLMSSKRTAAPLSKIDALHSTSRAAYGFSKGQVSPPKRRTYGPLIKTEVEDDFCEQEDYDSNDLDAPSRSAKSTSHIKKVGSNAVAEHHNHESTTRKPQSNQAVRQSGPATGYGSASSKPASKAQGNLVIDSDDDEDLFGSFARRKKDFAGAQVAGQQAPRIKKEANGEGRKTTMKADEIPTFLV